MSRSMLWSALASLAWLGLSVLPAHANRFGPPWQSRVVADRATLFSQPDAGSAPVGPLVRDQIVVVVNETTAADGTAWCRATGSRCSTRLRATRWAAIQPGTASTAGGTRARSSTRRSSPDSRRRG